MTGPDRYVSDALPSNPLVATSDLEAALAQSELRYRSLFEESRDARVLEHAPIEDVDRGVDRRITAQLLEQVVCHVYLQDCFAQPS